LPIISYSDLSEAIAFIQSRPKPLAMYWYGSNQEKLNTLLEKTSAGGVTVNDSFLHFSNHYLPFGGIGPSGMGSYHGKHGFDTFTHYKPVFSARSFLGFGGLSGTKSAHPPYGKAMERVLKMLRKK
jgi:coniferyl-aldehyde dehydrogenase